MNSDVPSEEFNIFLTGLTSVALGGMERYNLGNYAIMEPLIETLREEFPAARIATTIQMSDAFCERFHIENRREPRFWTYGRRTFATLLVDSLRAGLWRVAAPLVGRPADRLLKGSLLLEEFMRADVVVDFSGDLFGENARSARYFKNSMELFLATVLRKPVVMFAGSPGPFRSWWRRRLARRVVNRVALVVNREPISESVLREIGSVRTPIRTAACPSFLFRGHTSVNVEPILRLEGIDRGAESRPKVGVIICGWNMPSPPYNRVPRPREDLEPFLPMLRYLRDEVGAHVVLMSHSHRLGPDGEPAPGNDAVIVQQLMDLLGPGAGPGRVTKVEGLYDAATMKALIGELDMLVSGRVHGAVSGLSQGVPTVIVDYGHEPKAHKLRGFAKLLDIEECVCLPTSAEDLVSTVRAVWEDADAYRQHLTKKVAEVKADARGGFRMLRQVVAPGHTSGRTSTKFVSGAQHA